MESESRTRKSRIDPLLKALGWTVVPFAPNRPLSFYSNCAIEEYPTDNGPADYALCLNGEIVGVVEAKKVGTGPQEVLTQAQRYSRGVSNSPYDFDGHYVPFLYSTNGELIWFQDVRHSQSRSRRISDFHTPAALTEMLERNFEAACDWLCATPNQHHKLRPYQIEANNATERAIAERKRQMLIAMATGTGKTFTLVNQVYRLMKSGVAPRILFLVDRRALAAQAVRAFASFEPEPGLKFDQIYEVYSQRFQREDFDEDERFDPKTLPSGYLRNPNAGHAFVYVSTIQRMTMSLFGRDAIFGLGDEEIDEEVEKEDIPIHAFDVIIADECHRGYTSAEVSTWRKTLDHFDAIKIGLTATPAAHTKAYFKDVIYRYEYERAVREGYLVDYDVVTIESDVRMKGVFLSEGEQVGIVNLQTGSEQLDLLEDQRSYEASEVEDNVTSPDSNRRILEEIKKYGLEHESRYGRFPKTLIFAANDIQHRSHAESLIDIGRDVFGQGDSFVQKITGARNVDRPLQRIREFRNRPEPHVVVTVDMLSTGVDIPDLEYIVFLRPVKSRILFEQMLGRGTRKGERFPDKSHFTVFDCFDGTLLDYFKQATSITAEPPEKETRTIKQIIDDVWSNRDRDYNIRCLVRRLQRIEKEMSGKARDEFAAFIPNGDMGRYARELTNNLKRNFTEAMTLLRNPTFQALLVNYHREPKVFVVAHETQDTVSSTWLVRGLDGKEYKPEDYLAAFSRFIKDNPAHVEAIEILLERPNGWGTDALTELRQKLSATTERFTQDNLEKAHRLRYDKALVDIISMVKHAAREDAPLFTASERVARAFETVTRGKQFSDEQRHWLDRISDHLVVNLSIDKEDFEVIQVFTRFGGWGKANRTFNNQLGTILQELNEAIAA
jgi:type I restriction enzyme R subunit